MQRHWQLLENVNLPHCLLSSLLLAGNAISVPAANELFRLHVGCPLALSRHVLCGVDCHGSDCGLLALSWPAVVDFDRHAAATWRAPGKDSAARERTDLNLIMMREWHLTNKQPSNGCSRKNLTLKNLPIGAPRVRLVRLLLWGPLSAY